MKKFSLKSSLLLFLAAFIWGVAFVAQSVGMDYMGPLTFNGARFLMGSLVLLPFVLVRRKQNKKTGKGPASLKTTIVGGVCCGLALCSAALFQQYGIMYTTVGKAGFITTLYIILVPFFGIFLKKRIPGKVWIGAVIAAAGMYLLCMSERLALSRGDTLVFICAILFSVHILIIDHFSPMADGVELSCAQFLVVTILSAIGMLASETPSLEALRMCMWPILYVGIFSSGVAYTLQILAQKDSNPTVVSLLLSLESVFATLAGAILLHDQMSGKEYLGCVLMLAAVVLAQLPEREKTAAEA